MKLPSSVGGKQPIAAELTPVWATGPETDTSKWSQNGRFWNS